jgi:uncharacterized protein (TIGR02596 family)
MTGLFKRQPPAGCRSFTLLETLMVLAVTVILIAMAMGAYAAIAQSTAVTTGADMISDLFTEGRSDAVAQNTTVEVRIYDLPPQPNAAPVYDALQLHWNKSDGTTPPVARPLLLSSWVVIDATTAHSPLIAANTNSATPDASDTRLTGNTRVFHFLPDGSTDLNPASNWFMTVRAANEADPTHFPANWACVAIDATTGRTQIYRP